jgi:hypothetical protein
VVGDLTRFTLPSVRVVRVVGDFTWFTPPSVRVRLNRQYAAVTRNVYRSGAKYILPR